MPLMNTSIQLQVFHFQMKQKVAMTCWMTEEMTSMIGVLTHSWGATELKGLAVSHFLSRAAPRDGVTFPCKKKKINAHVHLLVKSTGS